MDGGDFVNVRERLIQLQKERGWSDYKIAKEAGLSPDTVSNIYKRGNTPSLVTIELLCKAFGITMAQFFSEGNIMEVTPELKELFEKWSALSEEQKKAIWQVIKTYDKWISK